MKIVKRNGQLEDFDANKIYGALIKAAQSVFVVSDDLRQNLARIAKSVEAQLEETHSENITISMIQALVEENSSQRGIYKLRSIIFRIVCSEILTAQIIEIV